MDDPWGAADAPLFDGPLEPLPPRLARLAAVQSTRVPLHTTGYDGFPNALELPEVRALTSGGWTPLDGAPLHCLLPAAWPIEHRGWVRDRLPQIVGIGGSTDEYSGTIGPLPESEESWLLESVTEQAELAGLPAPPRDRIWLLRSPWPRIPLTVIITIIWTGIEQRSGHEQIQDMYRHALEVFTWTEDEALAACPRETRDLLDAWAAVGRVGEQAGQMIDLGWTPADVEDMTSRTGLAEHELIAWRTPLPIWDEHDEAIAFINAWRGAGLSEEPFSELGDFLDRDLGEVRQWLDAGFDLHAANVLRYARVDTALRWREAGFTEADTYETLRRDPDLTPEEAQAFADAIDDRRRRLDWIYYGFTPDEAVRWGSAGLTPEQARVWRALSKQPSDVRPGPPVPPEILRGGRYYSSNWAGEHHDLADPPGTRGRYARRQRRNDPNPWIHWD